MNNSARLYWTGGVSCSMGRCRGTIDLDEYVSELGGMKHEVVGAKTSGNRY